jgi:hypothetical protein
MAPGPSLHQTRLWYIPKLLSHFASFRCVSFRFVSSPWLARSLNVKKSLIDILKRKLSAKTSLEQFVMLILLRLDLAIPQ